MPTPIEETFRDSHTTVYRAKIGPERWACREAAALGGGDWLVWSFYETGVEEYCSSSAFIDEGTFTSRARAESYAQKSLEHSTLRPTL